jgi:radical SAM superfamily enzyme YgiQ (UPF0313 family)
VIVLPVTLRERNVVKKNWRKVKLRIALCYPNIYRAGITSLGVQLLYFLFNSLDDLVCERVFYVAGETPRSMESGQPLHRFDVLAFSFQFETDYVHAVEMLVRSGIPPFAKDRKRPFIIAGGPCAMENPFPMAPFMDAFLLGDLEPVFEQLVEALIQAKSGADLESLLDDQFYLTGRSKGRRSYMMDLDKASHPLCQVLPQPPYPSSLDPTFGQSLLVEISRGCDRRCNFCLTSYQCSPRRERSLNLVEMIVDEGTRCTAVDKVVLIASALVDYSQLPNLLETIVGKGLSLSVPSLRADVPDLSILDTIKRGGQRTLTFAPEAGSQRLRSLVGKSISEDTFQQTFRTAIDNDFNLFKLYFLIGLPTEVDDDITAIKQFCTALLSLPPRRHRIHVSIAPFIPKPHTPFQWLGLTPLAVLKHRINLIRKSLRVSRIKLDLPNPRWSVIQAALSKGTAELAPIILQVAQANKPSASTWFRVARNFNINLEEYASASLSTDIQLPWEIFDVGLNRNTLLRRYTGLE